jgi:alpha-L-arabinofuranosidase
MDATRRHFVKGVVGAGALLAARQAKAADAEITVFPHEPTATISPDLYGHFTENIGGVIYDGLWVGRDSKIPNYGGVRKSLVDAFKKLNPPVVRWPGGCFADSYDWRDGVGPMARRPVRSNFWIDDPELKNEADGPQKYDPNAFGTHEFMQFCRLSGAQPYFAANLRSLPAKDFYQWVEYCNAPAVKTTLSRMRAENGDAQPFHVRFWGVGNEAWGCGGNFNPEAYASEFRRFTAWIPQWTGNELAVIASGPNGDDVQWTRRFFQSITEYHKNALKNIYGWAMHYYCGTAGNGQAVDFTEADWYELLGKAIRMEDIIQDHWRAMGEVDREHRVKLVVDEWGAWHKRGTEADPTYLFGQMPTMRDALITGLTLDIFHRHADKIAMANVAQLVNNLHCLFLAREDQFLVTPNYHVFDMYSAHKGNQLVRSVFNSATAPSAGDVSKTPALPLLAGSASVRNKHLVLSIVNSSAHDAQQTQIRFAGASASAVRATVLAASDIHAHNTFAEPNRVRPQSQTVRSSNGIISYSAPPASVTVLEVDLA